MFEKPEYERKESENKFKNFMKVAALVAAISPVEGKAEEIPEIDGASWGQGVEVLNESANHSKHEVGALFYKTSETSGEWRTSGESRTRRSVTFNTDDIKNNIKEFENEHDQVIEVCHAHTHPLSVLLPAGVPKEEIKRMYENGDYLVPPSLPDLEGAADHRDEQMTGKPTISSVFTPMGVWYYRPATDEDYSSEFPTAQSYYEESQTAMQELVGEDGRSGVLRLLFEELGVAGVSDATGIIFESEEELSPLEATEWLGKHLKKVRTLQDPVVESLREINDEMNKLVLGAVKLKSMGSYLYSYSYFHSAYNNVSEEYDDKISKMFKRDINEFRNGIPDYNAVKNEKAGDGAVSLKDNLEDNLVEDMLMVGVVGRYVPQEQLAAEPPCAGPDYRK